MDVLSGKLASWTVVLVLAGGLIGLLVFLRFGSEQTTYDEQDLVSSGFQVEERETLIGQHGEMLEVTGRFNDELAVAVVHRGSGRGWDVPASELHARVQEIRGGFPDGAGRAFSYQNVSVACPRHDTCLEFEEAFREEVLLFP